MQKYFWTVFCLMAAVVVFYLRAPISTYLFDGWVSFSSTEKLSTRTELKENPWKLTEVAIGKAHALERIYFYDRNVIFGVKYGKSNFTLFRTLNGGKSWAEMGKISDIGISDIVFVNPDLGFLTGFNVEPSSFTVENGSVVMRTEDGGLNWKIVHSSVNTSLSKVKFNEEGIGVAVGRKDIPSSEPNKRSYVPFDTINLVLITDDGGQTWAEVSEDLNKLAVKVNDRIVDSLSDVLYSNQRGIVVLSQKGWIYKTTDLGRSWSRITRVVNEPPQTRFWRIEELENGRLWAVGGANSIDGVWGLIGLENDKLGWRKVRLTDSHITNVSSLTGYELVATVEESPPLSPRKAAVLYSLNLGENWSVINEGKTGTRFSSIFVISPNQFLAVKSDGDAILFER